MKCQNRIGETDVISKGSGTLIAPDKLNADVFFTYFDTL